MALDVVGDIRDRIVPWMRQLGHEVTFVPGWETRGSGRFAAIDTRLEHHDAFPARSGHVGGLRTCTFGRPDLRNSLCMFYVGSDPSLHIVAAGISWHAGKGKITSNARSAGSEARNDGIGEPWPAAQLQLMLDLDAICQIVWGTEVYEHKEHSTTGKIDRARINGGTWRGQVNRRAAELRPILLGLKPTPTKPTKPAPTTGGLTVAQYDDIMARLDAMEMRQYAADVKRDKRLDALEQSHRDGAAGDRMFAAWVKDQFAKIKPKG